MSKSGVTAVDAVFSMHGIDAVFTPQGGEPASVRVVRKTPDDIVEFGENRIHTETALFEMRRSEAVTPQEGDAITADGEDFVIHGAPQTRDTDRLVWTMEAYPA